MSKRQKRLTSRMKGGFYWCTAATTARTSTISIFQQTGTYQTIKTKENPEKSQANALRSFLHVKITNCKHWPRDHSHNATASLSSRFMLERHAGRREELTAAYNKTLPVTVKRALLPSTPDLWVRFPLQTGFSQGNSSEISNWDLGLRVKGFLCLRISCWEGCTHHPSYCIRKRV